MVEIYCIIFSDILSNYYELKASICQSHCYHHAHPARTSRPHYMWRMLLGHPFSLLSVQRAQVQLVMRADQTAGSGHVKISEVLREDSTQVL